MIYSGIITSKNGSEIPLFTDGLPMHSKYNPEREAVQFAEGIAAGFALVIGIGGAYHIAFLKKTRAFTYWQLRQTEKAFLFADR